MSATYPRPAGTHGPAGGGALPLKEFKGSGFTVQIPQAWVDDTIYTLEGPQEGEASHTIWITPDAVSPPGSVKEYAGLRIRTLLESGQNWRLARRKDVVLAPGLQAVQADLRWHPMDGMRLYQRHLFVAHGGVYFTLFTQMTKKSRATLGPSIDRLMLTFRPSGFTGPAPVYPDGSMVFAADRFTLLHSDAWSDETVYSLSEPEQGRFRRNLLVRRDVAVPPPDSIEEFAEGELELMTATIPGFELVEKGEAEIRDGEPAHRVVFRRDTPKGGKVRQTMILALRKERLYTLALTTEEALDEALRGQLSAIPASLKTVHDAKAAATSGA